ncbi:MAG: hypothetical protein Q8N90_04125 [bacterium]|nr:hypothetical protein [bacterium]
MKKVMWVILCGILLVTIGCMTDKDREAAVCAEPTVTNWLPETTFRVFKEVKRVDGLDMGRAIIRRTEDGILFSVMVVPMREIPVGSEVKISEVNYMHHPGLRINFFVVR